jgi:hypothetical protein
VQRIPRVLPTVVAADVRTYSAVTMEALRAVHLSNETGHQSIVRAPPEQDTWVTSRPDQKGLSILRCCERHETIRRIK